MSKAPFHTVMLICGLALLANGCTMKTSAPKDRAVAAVDTPAERDGVVLRVVFDDMMRKENSNAPHGWAADDPDGVYGSKNPPGWLPRLEEVLLRHDKKQWYSLTQAQLSATSEAAGDWIARAEKGESLPELKSSSGRLKVYEDAGAATQPTAENPYRRLDARPSSVYAPGYSKDGRFAVVRLGFPWSMHSGEVTYVLERTDRGWKVLLRDFVYYV